MWLKSPEAKLNSSLLTLGQTKLIGMTELKKMQRSNRMKPFSEDYHLLNWKQFHSKSLPSLKNWPFIRILNRKSFCKFSCMSLAAQCGGDLTGPGGVILSPNWPEWYGEGEDCSWRIHVDEDKRVLMDVQLWDTMPRCDFYLSTNRSMHPYWAFKSAAVSRPSSQMHAACSAGNELYDGKNLYFKSKK